MGLCDSSEEYIDRDSKPTIGYWQSRGMGAQVFYLLAYCKVDYNFRQYTATFENGEVGRGEWPNEKFNLGIGFPNLPYIIDGNVKLAETMPLMRYICLKWKPELIGRSLQERAEIDMMGAVINDLKVAGVMIPCYVHGDREKIEEDCKKRLEPIVKWLGDKKFLMGNNICYLDFILFECTNVIEFVSEGRVWTDYPILKPYNERIRAIPELADAIKKAEAKAFNNPFAKLNNK